MATPRNFDNGTFNAACDVCGRIFRGFQLTKRWDGLMVCSGDWETRQPQDFVRGVADIQTPPWTRPEEQDYFLFSCTPITSQGIADYGVADCARAGTDYGYRPECTMEGSVAIPGIGYGIAGCMIAGRPQPGT
jgi:hypothetical protein